MKLSYIISAVQVFVEHLYNLFTIKGKANLHEIQWRKFRKLVDYAWNNIPAYRKLWEKSGFHPSQLKDCEDVLKIPMIDKDFIRDNLEDLVPVNYDRNRLSLVTTGGTTGMPMKFFIDQYVARPKELAYQLWAGFHYWRHRQGIDRVVTIRGARIDDKLIQKGVFWKRNPRENGIIMSSFHILEENYEQYLCKLRSYKPRFIKAYPSAIASLCILMQKHGDKKLNGLKGVICSSETIYDWHRTLVKDTLGVEIYSFYGHSEKAICAYQNRSGLMEFQPMYGYTEFLDDLGQPVSGEKAIVNLVATSLDNYYFPFIRYQTGDCARLLDNINMNVVEHIIGRRQEFVYDSYGNKVLFTCNDEAFWGIDGIIAYQYIQKELGALLINLQVDSSFSINLLDIIRRKLQEIFVNFTIEIKIVATIEKTKNGKFRYLIQYLAGKM